MAYRFDPPIGACWRCEREAPVYPAARTPRGEMIRLCVDCIKHLTPQLREGRPARPAVTGP